MTDPLMDLNEFRDAGFLQEVNRMFFHPLGLELQVKTTKTGKVSGLGPIRDCRDNDVGITFDTAPDQEAWLNVQREHRRHASHRRELMRKPGEQGHVYQPLNWPVKGDG